MATVQIRMTGRIRNGIILWIGIYLNIKTFMGNWMQ